MISRYISFKLGLSIILLIVAILVPLAFSIHQFFVNFYEEQVISSLVSHGRYVERMIRDKELSDPSVYSAGFFNVMDSELVLVDADFKVVQNTGVPMLQIGDSIKPTFISALTSGQFIKRHSKEWMIVGIPVRDSQFGAVFLYAPREPILELVNQVQRMIFLAGIGAILLAIGLTWVVSRRMVDPLLAMKDAALDLSKGNFKVKIPVKGNDEVAQLGEAINRLAQDLYRLQTSRKEFLSSVSHELRTPLSYVKGYSQALDENMLTTEEERKKYIKVIRQETDWLARLVEDLFDLTKMDEGQLRLSMEHVDLDKMIHNMIHTMNPRAKIKQISLHYEPIKPKPLIKGDYSRLSQVLFNLIDNAIQHTPSEGKINVNLEAGNDHIKMIVKDTGNGIPKEELPYIWERFYRVDKSRARGLGGTGLGLSIVKQIVEGHHGTVHIESEEQIGTVVTVILPISEQKG